MKTEEEINKLLTKCFLLGIVVISLLSLISFLSSLRNYEYLHELIGAIWITIVVCFMVITRKNK